MLKIRIVTAVVLGAVLLLGIFGLPTPWSVAGFAAVFVIGAWEWAAFGRLEHPAARAGYAALVAALLYAGWRWAAGPAYLLPLLGLACGWWAAAFVWLVIAPTHHRRLVTLCCGLPVLVPPFLALAHIQTAARGFAAGPTMVLWLILLVSAADVGAYFAGRRFGRRKLSPRVSPGKTWEGAAGGLLLVGLVALIGALYFSLNPASSVVFACAIGVFSVIGDLTESMFKRAAGLKDSGTVLPGHGGLMDRIDSVTAAAPLYALGLFGAGVIA